MLRLEPMLIAVVVTALVSCKGDQEQAEASSEASVPQAASKQQASEKVGYDIRRLRPRNEERLSDMFDRLHAEAVDEGKTVAVLFSADWCEPCRRLELELGNLHPASDIGHMRILEIKEEDWEAVTRMNEFNTLRRRWYAPLNSYPVFIVLNEMGGKVEEMKEAIERLQAEGEEPTVATWFRSIAQGRAPTASVPPPA